MRNRAWAAILPANHKTASLPKLSISMMCLLLLTCVACQNPNREPVVRSAAADSPVPATTDDTAKPLNGLIVEADQVTAETLARWKQSGVSVALNLTTDANRVVERQAAESILAAGLELDYFIEVGRCPELANKHPQWMASLQGHPGWRKSFPDTPQPNKHQVIKNFPWVPILYQESAEAHLARIKKLLADKPSVKRIWLNDLQGAPSACGCGHPLCRWTADYGPIKTATSLSHQAAADFVKQVRTLAGTAEIVPIFVGECEADDKDTACCGVACFEGKCWKDFTKQLDLLAKESDRIGVACFYQMFERDLERYESEAGWVKFTLNSFSEMPKMRNGSGVTPDRLIAVLQGWDVSDAQVESQIQQAKEAGAAGWLIALAPIDQSWRPVLFDLPPENDVPDAESSDHQRERK